MDHLQLPDVFEAEVSDSTSCPGSQLFSNFLKTSFFFCKEIVISLVCEKMLCLSRDARSRVRERLGHPTIIRWLTCFHISSHMGGVLNRWQRLIGAKYKKTKKLLKIIFKYIYQRTHSNA